MLERGSLSVDLEGALKNRLAASFLTLFALMSVSVPLSAHHGNATYESKTLTMKGTVTAWMWINPHGFLKLDVKDDQGNVVNWVAELLLHRTSSILASLRKRSSLETKSQS